VTPLNAEQRGALLCVKSNDVAALVRALDEEGIVTSERDSNLRISPHAYNTGDDVEAVLDALRRHRRLLA
jgi:selenocysteine lyase/cysteine desulfurase